MELKILIETTNYRLVLVKGETKLYKRAVDHLDNYYFFPVSEEGFPMYFNMFGKELASR